MNCVNTGVGEFCEYFRKQGQQYDQKVFMFPYHLDEGSFNPTAWRSVKIPEQVVIDVRKENDVSSIKMCQQPRTFNKTFDVWSEKPRLVACEIVSSTGIWNQSVEYL